MDAKEVRLRCIEAVSHSGVRDPQRIVKDAKVLEEWVDAAEEKEQEDAPPRRRGRPRKDEADKGDSPA